jgi:hypothetical protein
MYQEKNTDIKINRNITPTDVVIKANLLMLYTAKLLLVLRFTQNT